MQKDAGGYFLEFGASPVSIRCNATELCPKNEFLKMNLYYGHKCRRSFFNTKGFSVGSPEYKKCVLNKGRKS